METNSQELKTTTWNPVTGCDRVSAGCDHCYALSLAKRLKSFGLEKYQSDGSPATSGPGFGVTTHPKTLEQPYGWQRPRVIFVTSMGDLFHPQVPPPSSSALDPRRFYRDGRNAAPHLPTAHQASRSRPQTRGSIGVAVQSVAGHLGRRRARSLPPRTTARDTGPTQISFLRAAAGADGRLEPRWYRLGHRRWRSWIQSPPNESAVGHQHPRPSP